MSDTGLFSGLYTRVREYAELLDEVIIGLKSGTSSAAEPHRQRLAKLLLAIDQLPATDLSTQLFAVLVREQGVGGATPWSAIGRALQSADVSAVVIDQLERLARGIEHERAGMLASLRGHGR